MGGSSDRTHTEVLNSCSCALTSLCICIEEHPAPVDVLETREALTSICGLKVALGCCRLYHMLFQSGVQTGKARVWAARYSLGHVFPVSSSPSGFGSNRQALSPAGHLHPHWADSDVSFLSVHTAAWPAALLRLPECGFVREQVRR